MSGFGKKCLTGNFHQIHHFGRNLFTLFRFDRQSRSNSESNFMSCCLVVSFILGLRISSLGVKNGFSHHSLVAAKINLPPVQFAFDLSGWNGFCNCCANGKARVEKISRTEL